MKTQGLGCLGERKIEIRPMETAEPGPDEVTVALRANGTLSNERVRERRGHLLSDERRRGDFPPASHGRK